MDGKIICTDSDDSYEVSEAQGYCLMTENGRIGKRFWCASPMATEFLRDGTLDEKFGTEPKPHYYEVVERLEEGDYVLVRVKFLGTSQPE